MPLKSGNSRETIASNIHELTHNGSRPRSHDQIVAIALSNADHHPRAMGGIADAGFAAGGFTPASPMWEAHQAARNLSRDTYHASGLFHGDTAGRTDRLPRSVPVNSFVMPADVVSGLGQGSTLAGAKIMDGILSSGPFGTKLRGHHADGGNADEGVSHVMVASGEYLVGRDKVEALGNRMRRAKKSKKRTDLEAGHEALRGLVEKVRGAQKKFLSNAPKPKS